MCFTWKDLQGPSGYITPVDNTLPKNKGNPQQRGLFGLKSDLDICGNIADLICYTKNEVSFHLGIKIVFILYLEFKYLFSWNQ